MPNLLNHNKITIFTCLLILLILPGCFFIKQQKQPALPSLFELNELYEKHLANLHQIKSWKLSAKMQIKTNKECSKVLLTWKQIVQNYNLHITGPLAVHIADITGDNNHITVKLSDELKTSDNPNTLITEMTGLNIPINSLEYWIKAIPDPNYPLVKTLNNYGYISELQQLGYIIKYNNYKKFNTKIFPTSIQISAENIRLTIIIDKWKVL
jgi:outer membrane lipoprotein LolB